MSGECDGSSQCHAQIHIHGCYADVGNCDDPAEHAPPAERIPTRVVFPA